VFLPTQRNPNRPTPVVQTIAILNYANVKGL
jgi:hypothetical protein